MADPAVGGEPQVVGVGRLDDARVVGAQENPAPESAARRATSASTRVCGSAQAWPMMIPSPGRITLISSFIGQDRFSGRGGRMPVDESKTKVTIFTSSYRIKGFIDLVAGARVTDFMAEAKDFIAVTNAEVWELQPGGRQVASAPSSTSAASTSRSFSRGIRVKPRMFQFH